MPRQLKTYVTASGFFEQAVAAPSMKAAIKIWGAGPDLFRRGNAKETNDAAIVKATMAKPGAVLKRAVGGHGAFNEHANLPDVSAWKQPVRKRAASEPPVAKMAQSPKAKAVKPKSADQAAERDAARQFEAARKKSAREAARAPKRRNAMPASTANNFLRKRKQRTRPPKTRTTDAWQPSKASGRRWSGVRAMRQSDGKTRGASLRPP